MKTINLKRQEAAQRIFSLCLAINQETPHDVIFQLMGHIEKIGIQFYEDGWYENKDMEYMEAYLDDREEVYIDMGDNYTLNEIEEFLKKYEV